MSRKKRSAPRPAGSVRKVVKTVELEPEDYVRIALTMPSDTMKQLDEASKLYGITRSRIIQNACKMYLEEELLDTAWLRDILVDEEVKRSIGYDVDTLVDYLSMEYVPGINEEGRDLTLLPEHLQMIKKSLETERNSKGQSKWIEFCEKTGIDPKNVPKDRSVKLIFAEAY